MNRDRPISAEHYARRVASDWERLSGRAVILSEREWRLLCDWHARGVPLELLEQAMRAAVERRSGVPRSLAFIAAAVEEAWATVRDGRTTDVDPVARDDPHDAWRERRAACAGSPLGDVLERLLDARDAAALTAEMADARLDEELPAAVPEETLRRATGEVERRLAGFRGRLGAAELARSRERAIVEALRRVLGLPRLAGWSEDRGSG